MWWLFLFRTCSKYTDSKCLDEKNRGWKVACMFWWSLSDALMTYTQFVKTEGGVCGRHGRLAPWRVGKDKSPGYATAMLLCLSWGAKTVRAAEGRLRAALPSHVRVSISAQNNGLMGASVTKTSEPVCPTVSLWGPSGNIPHASDRQASSLLGNLDHYVLSCSIKLLSVLTLFECCKNITS